MVAEDSKIYTAEPEEIFTGQHHCKVLNVLDPGCLLCIRIVVLESQDCVSGSGSE
jgi:hypothetical protein